MLPPARFPKKKAVIAIAAAVGLGAVIAAAVAHSDVRIRGLHPAACDASYRVAYYELLSALERIEHVNARADRSNRKRRRIQRIIDQALWRSSDALHRGAGRYGGCCDENRKDRRRGSQKGKKGRGMSAAQFDELLYAVQSAVFEDGKVAVVQAAAQHNRFRADQVADLVRASSFSDTQLEIALTCYPKLVDKGNIHRICAAFALKTTCEELAKKLPKRSNPVE